MADTPPTSPQAKVVSLQGQPLDPETAGLPPPPLPPDCSFRQFDWMPFYGLKWLNSARRLKAPAGGLDAMLALMVEAWRQVPAASLPDDDLVLRSLAGLGANADAWRKVKKWVLEDWVLHSDGRLYHPDMVERAIDAWKAGERNRAYAANFRAKKKKGKAQSDDSAAPPKDVVEPKEVSLTSALAKPDVSQTSVHEKEREKERETLDSEEQSSSGAAPAPAPGGGATAASAARVRRRRSPPANPRQPEALPERPLAVAAPGGDLVDAMPGKAGAAVFWDESAARVQRIFVRSGLQCPSPDKARQCVGKMLAQSGSDMGKVAGALLQTELAKTPPAHPLSYMLKVLGEDKRPVSGIEGRSTGENFGDEVSRLARAADARRATASGTAAAPPLQPSRGPIIEGECS